MPITVINFSYSRIYFTLVIYISQLLNIYSIQSIHVNEPNVFYVNDDTIEGQRIGRITHFNGNQHVTLKSSQMKAVIVRSNRPPAVYFKLNENTGDLYTRTMIDRESLCLKSYHTNERVNSIPRDINSDFSQSNYQHISLSTNSKVINQCKFTFQVALHRLQSHQQHQSTEPGFHYLPEFLDIHIFIIDRNDHIPTFQPHSVINLSIPESVPIGTRIQLPLAFDPDSPEFSIQRYELYPLDTSDFTLFIQTTDIINNANLIQEITGLYLELKTILDREVKESYTLEVKAFDSSSSSTSLNTFLPSIIDNRNILKIFLTVEDINDNGPIFQPQNTSTHSESSTNMISSSITSSSSQSIHSVNIISYKVEIIESNWPKSPILQLITKDLDSSKYSLTRYEFASNINSIIKQLFKLNEHTGELFLKQPLDYEKCTSYSFDVLAIDNEYDRRSKIEGGSSHLINSQLYNNIFTSTANVIVNVLDINDEIPMIEVDYLRIDETTGRSATFASIEENSDPPQFIADILVTDRDANAANSHVICTLNSKSNRYQSNDNNNNNNDKNSSITSLFQLSEVRRQPGLVQYNMLTVNSLDREINGAVTHSEADLVVHTIDLNDNNPQIQLISSQQLDNSNTEQNIVHLKENAQTGTIVAHFNVSDQDSGDNSRTSCSLLSANDPLLLNLKDYFHVDPVLCSLITRKPIDRESTNPPISEIDLSIQVKDHGQPVRKSSINIKVKILNENDNIPMFQHTFYRFSIKENLPVGVSVGQIIITDLDGDYDRLEVRLQKQDQLPFTLWKSDISYGYISIDHSEAQVVIYHLNTTRILDREDNSNYEFEVYANDMSEDRLLSQHKISSKSLSHTTSATVLVTIEDENDNDPVIIFPQQANKTFILSNSEKKYYQLMTVNANDKDPSSNSFMFMLEKEDTFKSNDNSEDVEDDQIDSKVFTSSESRLKLKNITPNSFLEIDRSVGTVYLSRDIHQNDTGIHAFRVIVHDSIISPRTASLSFIGNERVERRVLSSGENPLSPEFMESNFGYNNHYVKSSNEYGILTNRKLDNIKMIFDNHSNTISSSSAFSSSSKQLTRRLTGDTVLILSLGLILLILLATLCLVIFARHWSTNSGGVQNSNSSDKIQCSNIFCCDSPGCKQVTNNDDLKKEVVNIFHSTPLSNSQDHPQMNINCDTIRSLDTYNASISDSCSRKMLDSDHIYYRDCRQFSILPVVATPVGSDNGTFPTDYTALRAMTSCKCCTPPPPGYTYSTESANQHSLKSFTSESLKNNTLQPSQLSNGSVTYYTTLSPRLRSDNATDKRKVRIITVKENMEMEAEKNCASDYSVT
ncbi:unnamed protein product [Heterobilharzia americana]|nr:unnamed protein product [Heterobilharzia americana]